MASSKIFDDISSIQDWLINQISKKLDLKADEIDIREDVINYGLNSMEAIKISGEIERITGVQISPTLIWDYPNIEELSRYLFQELKSNKLENILSNIEQMPETEMDDLLNSMLSDVDLLPDSTFKS